MLKKPVLLLVIAAAPAPALADVVIKKDGTRLRGVIVGEIAGGFCPVCGATGKTDQGAACRHCDGRGRIEGLLLIRVSGNTVSVKKSEIETVVRDPQPAPGEFRPRREVYKQKSAALRPDDADGHYELARWCISKELEDEASKHLRRTVELDPSRANAVEKLRKVMDHKRDARAKPAARGALALAESGEFEKAARAVGRVLAEHAKSPFVRSPEAQEALIRREFPVVYELLGSNLVDVASAAKEKARSACLACKGRGWSRCPVCRGSAEGVCPKCQGKSRVWCLDCNGTGTRICPRCLGTGEVRQTDPLVINPLGVCPRCRGKRTITCETCRGRGRFACPLCRGKGKVRGSCMVCAGSGMEACGACVGTGLRKVMNFRWGPVPKRPVKGPIVAEKGTGRHVWQGDYRGCVVTVLPSEFLHNGALRLHLNKLLGAGYQYLLICIDNREGTRQIVFGPEEKTVRFIMADARQVEMLDVTDGLSSLERDEVYRDLLPQFGRMAILPGAMANAVAPIDPAMDLSKVKTVFWGKDRPWPLRDYFLTRAQIEAFVRTPEE